MKKQRKGFLYVAMILGAVLIAAIYSTPSGQRTPAEKAADLGLTLLTGGTANAMEVTARTYNILDQISTIETTFAKSADYYITKYDEFMSQAITDKTNVFNENLLIIRDKKNAADNIVAQFRGNQDALDALKRADEGLTSLSNDTDARLAPDVNSTLASAGRIRERAINEAKELKTSLWEKAKEKLDPMKELLNNLLVTWMSPNDTLASAQEILDQVIAAIPGLLQQIQDHLYDDYTRIIKKLDTLVSISGKEQIQGKFAPLAEIVGYSTLSTAVVRYMEAVALIPSPDNIAQLNEQSNFGFLNGHLVIAEEGPKQEFSRAAAGAKKSRYADAKAVYVGSQGGSGSPLETMRKVRELLGSLRKEVDSPFALSDQAARDLDTAFAEVFAGKSAAEVSQNKAAIMNKVRGGLSKYPFMIPKIEHYLSEQADKWASQPRPAKPSFTTPQQKVLRQEKVLRAMKPSFVSITPQNAKLTRGGNQVSVEASGSNLGTVNTVQVIRAGASVADIETTLDKSQLPSKLKVSLKASGKAAVASDYQLAVFDSDNKKLLDVPTATLAIEVVEPQPKAVIAQKPTTATKVLQPIQRPAQTAPKTLGSLPDVTSVTPQKVLLAQGREAVLLEVKGNNLGGIGSVKVTRGGVEAQGIEEVLDKSQLPTVLKVSLKASAEAPIANNFQLTVFGTNNNKLLDVPLTMLAIEVVAPAKKAVILKKN
jgi:hypothetical protein